MRLTPLGQDVLDEITRAQAAWANGLARAIPFNEADIRHALSVLRHLRVELERAGNSATAAYDGTRTGAASRVTDEGRSDH